MVEDMIREENFMTAYGIIGIFCELLLASLPVIGSRRECPLDLKEAISSLCYAAPRCSDLPELEVVQQMLAAQYGRQFVIAASELKPDCGVNGQIVENLSEYSPTAVVKLKLLKIIAEHKSEWDESNTEAEFFKLHEDLLNTKFQRNGEDYMNPLCDRIRKKTFTYMENIKFSKFNGVEDPVNHLHIFEVEANLHSNDLDIFAKLFPLSLAEIAVAWFNRLPNGSIQDYKQLKKLFLDQYRIYIPREPYFSDFFDLKQRENQTVEDFLKHWKTIANKIQISDRDKISVLIDSVLARYKLACYNHINLPLNDFIHRIISIERDMIEVWKTNSNMPQRPTC